MQQRLVIIITIAVVLTALVLLNAASYVRLEKDADSEASPDRSTFNAGATGTLALYDFLLETGRDVMRWREKPDALLKQKTTPTTFVIIGQTALPIETGEAESLLRWVERGGRLVLVDRRPNQHLLPSSGGWSVTTELLQLPPRDLSADNPEAMTQGVQPLKASQPTALTREVETVLPSRFASLIEFSRKDEKGSKPNPNKPDSQHLSDDEGEADDLSDEGEAEDLSGERQDEPPPPPPVVTAIPAAANDASPAPVVHLANGSGPLLLDYRYGAGRIVLLSDPFIVANNGISRADNLQLALNIIAGGGGLIAFDEYHQGRAVARNQLIAYFAGTPVLAMFAQFVLIVMAVMWTRGRRFARPLPLPQVDRRSKLEYVASMAELQQRSRAYDLAIENIYARTRRALARYAGVDANQASRADIATRVAARSNLDRQHLEQLMLDCEDAINGAPVSAGRTLAIVKELRQIERRLGLLMRSRDERQIKERT